jgi:hypothetical protein
VAETAYTSFTSTDLPITARLIVRKVKDLNHQAGQGQDELFTVWRYHAVFTDSPFVMLQAEAQHRDHAQVEQVFADWASGPLAYLPSGSFPANATWLTLAAISHNLLRAAAGIQQHLAGGGGPLPGAGLQAGDVPHRGLGLLRGAELAKHVTHADLR